MEIALVISIIVIALLVFFLKNSVELNKTYENTIEDFRNNLEDTYDQLKIVDNNGAFESDDEVGFVFSYILNQIKELNTKYNQEDVKEEDQGKLE